ncbi:hypothetical protein BZA05DRAFT_147787 [Tricharina praecox]|uniref:uncharacterized protein n=1 Tax=Tricharina praecox TaxID=43433 RepID=UPI00221FF12F|nr:uncharacterized protein BZA05DRAFT_147787 [Tricharina praecox]KAI5845330.1 hypothetical protein BZA05DRAFT_147787 [Tricharina praecox]
MNIEERYGTLRTVVRRIARIAGAYNPRGIKIRFVNATNDGGFDGIVTEEQVETCLDTVVPKGGTQLGTRLVTKVIQPLILDRARRGELDRPVVVIIVTDGEPSGEDEDMLKNAILATKNELSKHSCGRSSYGPSSVVFHIARVGTSSKAKSFVRSLEEDEEVNDLLFSTDESLDWALGEAQSRGQLNTWVSSLEASDRIGWRGANGWWGI